MHQVFLGVRALLYFDGRADAGLSRALVMTTIGLVIGLLIGVVATRLYDARGFHRIAVSVPPAAPSSPGGKHEESERGSPGTPAADQQLPADPASGEAPGPTTTR